MPIPKFYDFILPLLSLCADGKERTVSGAAESIADHFKLSDSDRRLRLPSGQSTYIENRTGWARTYLKKAGLLESTRRGHFNITQRGREILEAQPVKIDRTFLMQFADFRQFQERSEQSSRSTGSIPPDSSIGELPPEEIIAEAYQRFQGEIGAELLENIAQQPPQFFEELVIELLVAMGYGGSRKEAGEAIGRSGDGGIDGIIKEDKLGLDTICIQAKRWKGVVGAREIRDFVGALHGRRSRKGIFITTSRFTQEAQDYAEHLDIKLVLIDGPELATRLLEHNIGVTPITTYTLHRIDQDYFSDE